MDHLCVKERRERRWICSSPSPFSSPPLSANPNPFLTAAREGKSPTCREQGCEIVRIAGRDYMLPLLKPAPRECDGLVDGEKERKVSLSPHSPPKKSDGQSVSMRKLIADGHSRSGRGIATRRRRGLNMETSGVMWADSDLTNEAAPLPLRNAKRVERT